MNYLVIYPGRFHPFHLGHKASYDWLANQFGENSVYIASSSVQDPETSPFTFADKVTMMTKLGVPVSHVVNVKNPYQATEITSNLSDEEKTNTALIFAVSAKDAERFNFAPKKDGTAAYLQPLPENKKGLKPMTKHGYVVVTPTVNFKVKGVDANSASQIRKLYLEGNDNDRMQIITDLYGHPDAELKSIFDERLGANAPKEGIIYGQEGVYAGDGEASVMRERREILRAKINEMREQLARFRKLQLTEQTIIDYIDERRPRKK
jgi:cytidyltransferase-like protein